MERKEFRELEKDLVLSSGRKVYVSYDLDISAIETYHCDAHITDDPYTSYEEESEWSYRLEGSEIFLPEDEEFTKEEIKEIENKIDNSAIDFAEENFWEVSSDVVYGYQL